MNDFTDDNYRALAIAVVEMAVTDYTWAIRFMNGKGSSPKMVALFNQQANGITVSDKDYRAYVGPYNKARRTIKECEKFFRSDLMELYMPNINGDRIIKTIRQRYSKAVPNYYEEHSNDT